MEEKNINYKIVNITIAVLGVLACMAGCFISAPAGILAEESTDLFHVLMPDDILTFFAVPALLIVLSSIIVMIGRRGILAVATALAGGALFGLMDYRFAMSNQSCYGTLINAIGVVLVITAALLQAVGTPSVKQLRREQRIEAEEEDYAREREEMMFFDESAGAADVSSEYNADEDTGIDINELRYEALRIESKEMSVEDSYIEKDISDDIAKDIAGNLAADSPVKEAEEEWSSDNDLEALLRKAIEDDTAQNEAEPVEISAKTISNAAAEAAAETAAENAAEQVKNDSSEFYGGLENLFLDDWEDGGSQ